MDQPQEDYHNKDNIQITDMQKLIKLRYLDISGTSLKEMPPDMCNIKAMIDRLELFVK